MLANPAAAALATELAEAVGRARDFAKASKAHATRKAYAADLRDFAAYCERIGALAAGRPRGRRHLPCDDLRNEGRRNDPSAHGRDRPGT
jgi:hypothetical protein